MSQPDYQNFLETLKATDFSGDVHVDYATRMTMATDNSIYQLIPQAVIFPKCHDDIVEVFKLLGKADFSTVQVSPRAGGTGTDGQSLTHGIVLDCSKYMRKISNLDTKNNTITVQPGVILDQLNEYLKPRGYFFAPSVSPSNRACLGGMFNTDGCGLGSAQYGRTSEHVLSVRAILIGGDVLQTAPMDLETLELEKQKNNRFSNIYQQVDELVTHKADLIQAQFPKMLRFMTGYNLAHIKRAHQFDLTKLLSGGEGTLAYISELKLNITPLPTVKTMIAVKYRSFDTALREGHQWLAHKPTVIETIDDKIITIARADEIWLKLKPMLEADGPDTETAAINLVEWRGTDSAELNAKIESIKQSLNANTQIVGYYCTDKSEEIAAWWELRKKSVGLLANLPGKRQPIPFVEDTAVPPEKLADFIQDFCAILDEYKLTYGMFGHVDAGCIHVRPALDMTDPEDAKLVKIISTQVHQLSIKYGGILWGEHGSGFRSQYIQDYFGDELYEDIRQIKALFDPHNQLNPGKIVTAAGTDLLPVKTGEQLRADRDGKVPEATREKLFKAFKCNGNAICMNYLPDTAICPSYKVTRNRIHSPKGRAVLLREWLYQRENGVSDSFTQQVTEAFAGCLGCKSCALSCPVQVDIPSLRAQFLAMLHVKKPYSNRDRLLIDNEQHLQRQSRIPWLFRSLKPISDVILNWIGLVDAPAVAAKPIDRYDIPKVSASFKPTEKTVLLVQDALTSFIEPTLVNATVQLLKRLGFEPALLPFRENGKARQNKGCLDDFSKVAHANNAYFSQFKDTPLIGIEPSFTLAYRDEYQQALKDELSFKVQLVSEWLVSQTIATQSSKNKTYYLMAHCTERALSPKSESDWKTLFERLGLTLEIIPVGCCGMAGSYGHEKEHRANSKSLFEMSWQRQIDDRQILSGQLLATGFSCRSQLKRFGSIQAKHPIEALLDHL